MANKVQGLRKVSTPAATTVRLGLGASWITVRTIFPEETPGFSTCRVAVKDGSTFRVVMGRRGR